MDGVVANFPNTLRRARGCACSCSRRASRSTRRTTRWARRWPQILITPGAARDRLTAGAYVPQREDDVIGRLEFAMEAVIKADPIEAKMRKAQKEGKLPQRTLAERRAAARRASGSSPQQEHDHLVYTDRLRARRDQGGRLRARPRARTRIAEEPWQPDSQEEGGRRVYVVDGARTPFLKAQTGLGPFTGSDLAVNAGRAAAAAPAVRARGVRRGHHRRGDALRRRGQHRARRLAAPGLRRQGPRVDGDAQLRLGHAGARLRAASTSSRAARAWCSRAAPTP